MISRGTSAFSKHRAIFLRYQSILNPSIHSCRVLSCPAEKPNNPNSMRQRQIDSIQFYAGACPS